MHGKLLIIFIGYLLLAVRGDKSNGTEKVVSTQAIEGGGSVDVTVTKSPPSISSTRIYGREHVLLNATSTTTEKIIPISESTSSFSDAVAEKNDNKKTVPRKGVVFNEGLKNQTAASNVTDTHNSTNAVTTNSTNVNVTINNTTKVATSNVTNAINSSTTIKPKKPKKPLITEADAEEPYAPSHFVSSKTKNATVAAKVPSYESYSSKSSSGSDYTIPIVGVILSVPLVAILINAVCKRTKEWWHHRHYSRMDFLIDGIYNN